LANDFTYLSERERERERERQKENTCTHIPLYRTNIYLPPLKGVIVYEPYHNTYLTYRVVIFSRNKLLYKSIVNQKDTHTNTEREREREREMNTVYEPYSDMPRSSYFPAIVCIIMTKRIVCWEIYSILYYQGLCSCLRHLTWGHSDVNKQLFSLHKYVLG